MYKKGLTLNIARQPPLRQYRVIGCPSVCRVVVSCVRLVYFYFFKEREKNEILEVGKRHTLLQTLVGALACSGLQMCVPVCWF